MKAKRFILWLILLLLLLVACSDSHQKESFTEKILSTSTPRIVIPTPTPLFIAGFESQGPGGERTRILVKIDPDGSVIANSDEAGYRYDLSMALSSPTGGSLVPSYWLEDAEQVYLGRIEIDSEIIDSDVRYPLTFKLIKDKGLFYMCGRGTITTADGKSIQVGDDDTIDSWLPMLNDPDKIQREAAAQALGWLSVSKEDSDRVIPALLAAMEDPAWEVRRNAAEALGRLKDLRAAEVLLRHAANNGESDEWVRAVAAEAYSTLTGTKVTAEAPEPTPTLAPTQAPAALVKVLEGTSDYVDDLAFSPDGQYLAASTGDNKVLLWHLSDGKLVHTFDFLTNYINLAFSPDSSLLAGGAGNEIKLWRVSDGGLETTLHDYFSVTSLAFSPSGQFLASGLADGRVLLWTIPGGVVGNTLEGTGVVDGLAFSPDGRLLASAAENKIRLWQAANGKLLSELEGHAEDVYGLAFSPTGEQLASASYDQTVRIWDVADGKLEITLSGHTDTVYRVSFSPDGRYLYSGSWDGTIRTWRLEDGGEESRLDVPGIGRLAFAPDGSFVATSLGSSYEAVYLWKLK